MRIGTWAVAACAAVCVQTTMANAQGQTWTLAAALERAREHAPQVVSSRLAVDEARARLVGASLRFQSNPELETAAGRRRGTEERFTDVAVGLSQRLESSAARAARIASADAAIASASAQAEETIRLALRATAEAFYRVAHANEQVRLLVASEALDGDIAATADRRFRTGDIAILDVNMARASLARTRARRAGAEASRALAVGILRELLQLKEDSTFDTVLPRPGAGRDEVLTTIVSRPEEKRLGAEIQQAEADLRISQSLQRAQYAVGARYAKEEGNQIVMGSVTVTLPTFSRGQEQRAEAAARAARLRAEHDAARIRFDLEVQAATEALRRRTTAVRVLELEAVADLDENERLAARSFEVGQIGLPELFLLRREILATRFEYLDALLEVALARVELDARVGVLR